MVKHIVVGRETVLRQGQYYSNYVTIPLRKRNCNVSSIIADAIIDDPRNLVLMLRLKTYMTNNVFIAESSIAN